MKAWLLVMDTVVAVVERDPVDEATDEVARMVGAVARVAAVMLGKVDGGDSPHRKEMRHHNEEQAFFPIHHQEREFGAPNHENFQEKLTMPRGLTRLHKRDIAVVPDGHSGRDCEKEKETVEQVPSVANLRGAHDVFALLREAMVRKVVARHIFADRKSVAERNPNLKRAIHPALLEDRAVHRVVCDYSRDPTKDACDDHTDRKKGAVYVECPEADNKTQVDEEKGDGSKIGSIT